MKNISSLLFICCFFLGFIACSNDDNVEPLPDWWWKQDTSKPLVPVLQKVDNKVVAHRGCWKETGFPNNSIAALKEAIRLKCFASECDIHITKDGKVVMYHDEKYYNTYFKDATYDELKAKGKLPNGEVLPLLEDYLNTAIEGKTTQLWIDVKTLSDAAGGNNESIKAGVAACAIIHKMNAKNFVGFVIGRKAVYDGVIGYVKGAWSVGYMNFEHTPDYFINANIKWANFNIDEIGLKTDFFKSYIDKGIKMSVYQIDTDEQMQWYKGQQTTIYGITNLPTKLLNTLGLER